MNSLTTKILVGLGLVAAAVLLVYFASPPGPGGGGGSLITTPTGLKYEDTTVGSGVEAKAGDEVTVHYTGTLKDGAKFDSSVDRGQPFSFQLGAREVIRGWDEGVQGMKVGGKRKLIVPADLAYGPQARGKIPANSELTFVVELLKVGK